MMTRPTCVMWVLVCCTGYLLFSGVAASEVLPWVDDYPRALAAARAKNVPLFVEAWAPW